MSAPSLVDALDRVAEREARRAEVLAWVATYGLGAVWRERA